jgi:outer membrane protein TolC
MIVRLLLSITAIAVAAADPLRPDELLASVERGFLLIEAALQERRLAAGALTAASGEFDRKLKAEAESQQFGYYRNESAKTVLEQPLSLFGATLYGGYRIGRGTFGPYDEKALTLSAGEWAGGFRLPLMQNREIDARRLVRRQAEIGVEIAEYSIAKERLKIYKSALKQYWDWVGTGRQLAVANALLQLAEQRNTQIEEQVKLGQLAPIELTDNVRAILQRRSALVSAQRFLFNAGNELSLYYRDAAGEPLMPAEDRLPVFPEPTHLPNEQEKTDLAFAMTERPEVKALLQKRGQQALETRWASNQTLPQVDLYFNYSRDAGVGRTTRRGNEMESGLVFELPLQRRKAYGKLEQAKAKLAVIEAEIRFTRDRILLDVQDAANALRASYNTLTLVRREVETARTLEDAERARFDLGDSSQFFVNQRELATADAALREVKSLADYFKARAEYDAATGRLLNRQTP